MRKKSKAALEKEIARLEEKRYERSKYRGPSAGAMLRDLERMYEKIQNLKAELADYGTKAS